MLAIGLLAGCGRASGRQPDVIVILVDTLRADRIGACGGTRGVSPFVDELAAHATVFRRAYAPAPWTNPSVASLFTSRWPSQHGVVTFGAPLDDSEETIAEAFKARGYATAAFVGNFVLTKQSGFGQGFDEYDPVHIVAGPGVQTPKTRAANLLIPAAVWLTRLPKAPRPPVFLYLHYIEPHLPYAPAPSAVDRLRGDRPRPDASAVTSRCFFANRMPLDAAELADVELLYDAEVLGLDEELRRLFSHLDARGLLHDAVVVFTSDHGEEFMEHGHLGHGQALYEELIHVPLIIRFPGQERQVLIDDPVSLLDVAPTLLDVAGVPAPPSFEGRSLRPHWTDWLRHKPTRPVVAELIGTEPSSRMTPHERGVVVGTHKLIVGVGGEHEAYDLAADPGEHAALDVSSGVASELDAVLRRWMADHVRAGAPAPAAPISDDLREKMRALGYAQ
jgi:arylsulfatase A-like enzyme